VAHPGPAREHPGLVPHPRRTEAVIQRGETAPDFELPDQDGNPVRLSDLKGSPVVLYFYPKADTPGCTTQACGIRDRTGEYEQLGARVLGVSPDKPAKLRKFADKYDLPFTLLADPEHEVAERYGTWVEKSMYGRKYWGVSRDTFVIDSDGKLAKVLHKVQPKKHDDLVLAALAEL
jgi:thioredoxin-dependent peroxiredoxin